MTDPRKPQDKGTDQFRPVLRGFNTRHTLYKGNYELVCKENVGSNNQPIRTFQGTVQVVARNPNEAAEAISQYALSLISRNTYYNQRVSKIDVSEVHEPLLARQSDLRSLAKIAQGGQA
jgi:hypothetical protein